MEQEWKYIDEFDAMPDAELIFADTRDFHIITLDDIDGTDTAEIDAEILKLSKQTPERIFEKFLFGRSEILGYLKSLEMGSGGNRKWRLLSFDVGHMRAFGDWCKYIRFRKISYKGFPCYFAYTTWCSEFFPLRWDVHCQENIK